MTGTITFFGAAGGVTGSKHLLTVRDTRILLDCGLSQGLPDTRERNRALPFPPESISAVVISHAHLDHIGMLPLLVKRGFTGPIYATAATIAIAKHLLNDFAHLETQDAKYNERHHFGPPDAREPLVTPADIPPVMKQFVAISYARDNSDWRDIASGVRLKIYDSGHILGSAIIVIEATTAGSPTYLAYTGDLGPTNVPLLHDPEVPTEPITTLLLESTYGSRKHEPQAAAVDRLVEVITRVCARGGKIIVPAFALGRTQLLVYLLHKMIDEQRIPRFPIYVDSPLAESITDVFQAHARDFDTAATTDFKGAHHTPLLFRNLTYVSSVMESKALNAAHGPLMIISASGMMTGGRVVHHLRNAITDPNNAVLITGFQAIGTPGRALVEGAKEIDFFGERLPVKAEIILFNEFSAHADSVGLQKYAEAFPSLKHVALVHGEPHQADDLAQQLKAAHPEWQVDRPNEGDIIPWG